MGVRRLAAVAVSAVCLVGSALAADVAGVHFEDSARVGRDLLVLNGAGVRTKFIIKVYAAGLYVGKKDLSPQALLSQAGAKRVQIGLLLHLSGEEFASAMAKGFKANNTAADVARFAPELEALKKLMLAGGDAPKGSRIDLDWVPGVGTRVLFNGQQKGADIAGEDFFVALLRIWLGADPVDADLKAALSGKVD